MRKQRESIYVIGYPKSGNTWISRLLGEVLNSPVEGYLNAKPIATEGEGRDGNYIVRQLHLKISHAESQDVVTANEVFVRNWTTEKGVFIMRDPRDIAVAVKFYWGLPDIKTAIEAMAFGNPPLMGIGAWPAYITAWENTHLSNVFWTCYENLIESGELELMSILTTLGLPLERYEDVSIAFHNQSFDVKRAQIAKDGDRRPYGKSIQLKNLRLGRVGDWRNHFTRDDAYLANQHFGEKLLKYDYVSIPEWWEEEI